MGRLQSRQKGLQNEYEFQQFFYDFLAGSAKGVINTVWQQGVGAVLGVQGSLALNGVAAGNPRVADALDKLYNPYQYSSHNQAIFGAFAAGATEVVGAYDAGVGAIGGAGEALRIDLLPRRGATQPYEIGQFHDLDARRAVGSGLEIHHVPQDNPAGQVIAGHTRESGIAIALPRAVHRGLPATSRLRGTYTGTSRQLISTGLRDLHRAGVDKEVLRKLAKRIRSRYPEVYKR